MVLRCQFTAAAVATSPRRSLGFGTTHGHERGRMTGNDLGLRSSRDHATGKRSKFAFVSHVNECAVPTRRHRAMLFKLFLRIARLDAHSRQEIASRAGTNVLTFARRSSMNCVEIDEATVTGDHDRWRSSHCFQDGVSRLLETLVERRRKPAGWDY